ncbi:Ig-like domain-containing protein [Rummeliibacillus stabekisii]|uniref:Ig-like domain-containing protein n=1 Tax=Rummeliibacillus stabekisii TaxID=241244 RepID=UPI00203E7281|nr:Ig-like domain-containing protein [Rummeliibacillus stabekisii]MCM3315296.1 Ig-like domain-containing protein [Rummeliibacillus stabekisii]
MKNFKLVKTTAALALGASVVTAAVVPGATTASAASKYKVSNGQLVNAKTGKVVKGYVVFKSKLYYNGKLKKGYKTVGSGKTIKLYYNGKLKEGYKTARNNKLLFFNGSLKKGYKTAGNGERLYKDGHLDKGYEVYGDVDKDPSLYYNGYLKSGYKTANNATLLFYNGKLKSGYKTAKEGTVLYKEGRLNEGLALVGGKLFKDSSLNKGIEKYEDKFYFDADLANGTYEYQGKEIAVENGVEVGAKVNSVEAINGTQLKVTFNKSIDESTVVGTSDALQNITVAKVGTTAVTGLTAELSDDKKSLTITSPTVLNGEYNVAVSDSVKTTTGDKVEASTKLIKVEDKVAPTYVGFTKENASTFFFNFSEPINDQGSVVVKKADGTVIPASDATVTKEGSSIKIVFSGNVEAGKDITVAFAGQTDYATNVLESPFTVTVQKGAKDGVAPEVTSVNVLNAKKFEIKFSEEVQGFTKEDLSVAGSSVTKVTQDKTDKTKYIVELGTAVSGLTNVSVADKSYADLTGEEGKAFSQIVNFAADTVKPTATAAISVNKDGNQVLTFTTSEDTTVIAGTTITLPAKAVKNYVTTSGNITFAKADLKAVTGSSTQYTVELSKVKFGGSALVKDTVYTVDLAADVFADVAGNKNEAKTGAFSFTRGADKDAAKPVLTDADVVLSKTDNDTFTVNFGKAVELDNSTVVNKANYYVAGATIESVTLSKDDNDNSIATVKLVSGSNNYNGNRTVKVTGIKAANGNVMDDFTTVKDFKENVKPTVQSAKVDTIEKGSKETTTTTPATAVASDKDATVTGTYTGTTDAVATYTYSTATSKWTADKELAGLTVTPPTGTTDGQSFTVTAKAEKTTTTPATSGKTTIKVNLSEEVTATDATEYVVNVGGKVLTDVKATVKGATNAKEVTITVDKELTAEDFANGVTLTSTDYKIVDAAGNKADIPATGIKVSL